MGKLRKHDPAKAREILKLLAKHPWPPWTSQMSKAIRAEQAMHANANESEIRAREKYGNALVTHARKAAIKAGLGSKFIRERDPYSSLMKWYLTKRFGKTGATIYKTGKR